MRRTTPQPIIHTICRYRRMAKILEIELRPVFRKKSIQNTGPYQLLFSLADVLLRAVRISLLFFAKIATVIISRVPGFAEYAYAKQESSAIVQDTTALNTAFGALLGSTGGIIVEVAGFLSNRSKGNVNSQELAETYNDLKMVALSLHKTDRWALENEEKLAALISAVGEFDPKIKESIQRRILKMKRLTQELVSPKNKLDEAYNTIILKLETPGK
jgi:hypothetical protein